MSNGGSTGSVPTTEGRRTRNLVDIGAGWIRQYDQSNAAKLDHLLHQNMVEQPTGSIYCQIDCRRL